MAIWRRNRPREMQHHSDQSCQYTSELLQRLMADNGVTCSMSGSENVKDPTSQNRNTEPQSGQISDGTGLPYRRDRSLRADGLAESH